MNPCDELAPLLAAHASGDCSAEERARVEAHLSGCEACRAEREDLAEVLSLAALPPAGALEEGALQPLPGQVRAAWRVQERGRGYVARWALSAAAAAALLTFSLGHLRRGPRAPHLQPAPVASSAQPAPRPAAASSSDTSLAVDSLADGPIELANEGTDPYANDPETTVDDDFSLEGDL